MASAFDELFDEKDESKRDAPTGSAFDELFEAPPAIDSRPIKPKGSITEEDLIKAFNTGDYSDIDAKYAAGDKPVDQASVAPQEDADAQVGFLPPEGPEEGPAHIDPFARSQTPDVAAQSLKRSIDRAKEARGQDSANSTLFDYLGNVYTRTHQAGGLGVKDFPQYMVRARQNEPSVKSIVETGEDTRDYSPQELRELGQRVNRSPENETMIRESFYRERRDDFIKSAGAFIDRMPDKMDDRLENMPGLIRFLDDVTTNSARFAPTMGVGIATGGMASIMSAYMQIANMSYDGYLQEGVPEDRAWEGAKLKAFSTAPIEAAGNVIQVGAFLKAIGRSKTLGGPLKQFAIAAGEAMVANGLEEISQGEVEVMSDVWTKNPDMPDDQKLEAIIEILTDPQFQLEKGYEGLVGAASAGGPVTLAGGPIAVQKHMQNRALEQKADQQATGAPGTTHVNEPASGVHVVTPNETSGNYIDNTNPAGRQSVESILGVAETEGTRIAEAGSDTSLDGVMTTKQAVQQHAQNESKKATEGEQRVNTKANKVANRISALEDTHDNLNAFYEKAMEEGDTQGAVEVATQIRDTVDQLGKEYVGLVETTNQSMTHKDEEIDPNLVLDLQEEINVKIVDANKKLTTANNVQRQVDLEAKQAKIEKLGTEQGLRDELIGAQVVAKNEGNSQLAKLNETVITEMNDKEVMGEAEYNKQVSLKKLSALRSKIGAQIAEDRVGKKEITEPERRRMKREQGLTDEQITAMQPTPAELNDAANSVAARQWVDEQIVAKQEFDLAQEERDLGRERLKQAGVVDRPKTVDRPAVQTVKRPKGPGKPVSKTAAQRVKDVAQQQTRKAVAKEESRRAAVIKEVQSRKVALSAQKAKIRTTEKAKPAPSKQAVAIRKRIDEDKQAEKQQAAAIAKQLEQNKDLAQKAAPEQVRGAVVSAKLESTKGEAKVRVLKEKDATYGIITAENQQGNTQDAKTNAKQNKALLAELEGMGLKPVQIKGQFGNLENPYLIPGISQKEITALGKKYNQESVIHTFKGVAKYIEGTTVKEGVKTSDIRLTPDADDFYSEIDGVKFVIPFFEDRGVALAQASKDAGVEYDINLDLTAPTLRKKMGTVEIADKLVKRMQTGKYKWLYNMAKDAGIKVKFVYAEGQIEKEQDIIRTYPNLKNRENFVKRFDGDLRINPRTGSMEKMGGVFGMYIRPTNTAYINLGKISGRAKDINKAEETVVHEVIHGIISDKFKQMTTPQKKAFEGGLKEIWDDIDQDMIKQVRDDPSTHPLVMQGIRQVMEDGIGELPTYAFAHPVFAEWLNTIPASQKFQTLAGMKKKIVSVWQAMADYIVKKVLNVPSRHDELVSFLSLGFEDKIDVRFSREEDFNFGVNISPETVRDWVTDIEAPGAAAVVVVKDSKEFEDQFGFGPPTNAPSLWLDKDKGVKPVTKKGIKYPGRPPLPQQVVFIASRITSQEHFMTKYLHEQAGHVGLRNLFGQNNQLMNRFLDQSYSVLALKDADALRGVIETYDLGKVNSGGVRVLTKADKRVAAEEVLAARAEVLKPPTKKLLTARFKQFLTRWLPKNFVAKVDAFKMTDEDLWLIMSSARESVFTRKTSLGSMLNKSMSSRRPGHKFKGYKFLPNFMEDNSTYKSWATEVAKKVPAARTWYEQHVTLMTETFGPDADVMSTLLALTSPQADVETNVIFATQSYLYTLGLSEKAGHRYPAAHTAKLDKWTDAKSMLATLESPNFKVTEFLRALMGDHNATVGDIWMFRAFFGDFAVHNMSDENPTPQQQVALRQKLHDLASELTEETGSNWTPREVQASIWVYINAKSQGKSFEQIADFMSGFNKPTPVFNGLTPLQYATKLVPNLKDGPLSAKLGLEKIPQSPVSTLNANLAERMAKAKLVNKYNITKKADIRGLTDKKDTKAVATLMSAIVDGGRTLTALNDEMAQWYKEVFGFEVVDGLDMRLSDQALDLYTSKQGIKSNWIRDNLGGFQGNFTQQVRFSREARKNLDQITEMSTTEQDAEFIRTGNDGMSVTGKIHEWRDQSGLNIDRLTDNLEQDFLEKFGGRKARTPVRKLGFASGKALNTSSTELLQRAMNLWIDSGTGANLEKAKAYAKELAAQKSKTNADKQRLATIERMLMLSEEEKTWADNNIREYYEEFFEFAQENQIIDSHVDNYVKRLWNIPKEYRDAQIVWNGGNTTGFKVTSDSGKQRSLDSIIDGWRAGFELKTEGVIPNLQAYASEIGYVHANRRFVSYMESLITFGEEADGLMAELEAGDRVPAGYKQITDRGFARPGKTLVARSDIADEINKLGERATHKLWDIPIVKFVRKLNAMIKSTILSVSLYHHLAGMRSYVFGVRGKGFKLNPITAYKRGLKKIDEQPGFENPDYAHLGPIVDMLVQEGLTIGRTQDWDEALLMNSILEEGLKKRTGKLSGAALKSWQGLRRFRRQMTTGLFGRLFAGLKAESAAIELVHNMKRAEKKLGRSLNNAEIKLQAQHTARLINADFGGLHTSRMGRNPDLQRAAQLVLLAPDWTESNWRTVTGMMPFGLNKGINKLIGDNPSPPGMEKVYRRFWRGIAVKGLMSVALANAAILTLFGDSDDVDDYFDMVAEQFTWKNFAKGKWLSVPLGPVYKALGIKVDPDKRALVSVLGHFKDILKLADLRTLAKHKISPFMRIFETIFSGKDWKGTRFTTFAELIETGKLTVDNQFAEKLTGPGEATTLLSLALYNARQSVPIFTSEALQAFSGEAPMISAAMRSMGIDIRDTKREPVNQQKYAKVNSEILALDKALTDARVIRDKAMVAEAKKDIKEYPGFNRTKARLGSAKTRLRPINSQLRKLKLKQDAGQTLTVLEERRMQMLNDRKQKIYDKFVEILER